MKAEDAEGVIHSYYPPHLAAESNNAASVGLVGGWGGWGGLRGGELAAHCDKLPSQVSDFQGFSDDGVDTRNDHNERGPSLQGDPPHPVSRGGGQTVGGTGALNGHFQRTPFEV